MHFSTDINCVFYVNQQPYINNIMFKLNENFFFYMDLNDIFLFLLNWFRKKKTSGSNCY